MDDAAPTGIRDLVICARIGKHESEAAYGEATKQPDGIRQSRSVFSKYALYPVGKNLRNVLMQATISHSIGWPNGVIPNENLSKKNKRCSLLGEGFCARKCKSSGLFAGMIRFIVIIIGYSLNEKLRFSWGRALHL